MFVVGVCAEVGVFHGMSIQIGVDGLYGESGVLRDPPTWLTLNMGGCGACFFTLGVLVAAISIKGLRSRSCGHDCVICLPGWVPMYLKLARVV